MIPILRAKRITSDFVRKHYPELYHVVSKISGLTPIQEEQIYGLCVDIAEKSDGTVSLFEWDVDMEDELDF